MSRTTGDEEGETPRRPAVAYADAAATVDIEVSRVTTDRAHDALVDRCEGLTVGSPLPFDGVSLPESVVTEPTWEQRREAETGVTAGRFAIAAYGTVAITATEAMEGSVSLFPPRHVAVVRERDVVPDMERAFDRLEETIASGDDDVVFLTGPSATADMGSLVQGVHGPAEMHVVLLEEDA